MITRFDVIVLGSLLVFLMVVFSGCFWAGYFTGRRERRRVEATLRCPHGLKLWHFCFRCHQDAIDKSAVAGLSSKQAAPVKPAIPSGDRDVAVPPAAPGPTPLHQ